MTDTKQLLSETRAYLCIECGKCSGNCPVAARAVTATPRALVSRLVTGGLEAAAADYLFKACLACGQCMERCPSNVDFVGFIAGLRRLAPQKAVSSCPHAGVFQTAMRLMARLERPTGRVDWLRGLEKRAREDGKGPELRFELVEGAHGKHVPVQKTGSHPGEQRILYFVGCLPYFDAALAGSSGVDMAGIAVATIRVLNAMGVVPLVLADERCCGHDLLWAGDIEAFDTLACRNLEQLERAGANTVVTACAECARTLRLDYPVRVKVHASSTDRGERQDDGQSIGRRLAALAGSKSAAEFVHVTEFLTRAVDGLNAPGKQRASGPAGSSARRTRVAFHDPCRLGRHLGVYDAPRTVLSSLASIGVVEMARERDKAVCCGVSSWLYCDGVSKQMQTDRLREAASAGASVLATACPKCKAHLACALAELKSVAGGGTDSRTRGELPEIRDIIELAADELATR
ncbi:MAG: (Fe-S)-binding protein [Planctomycetota bacterium]|nr:(Fe-S)-binding protein [Planctomycetota bacterium]